MPKTNKEAQSVRLPNHVKPEHYWLSLVPDFNKFTFSGEEIITLELTKPESTIQLHAKELKISEAFITDGDSQWSARVTLDQENEQASFEFESQLKKGTYNLNLKFSGALTDNMRGFYRSQFQVKGKMGYMAVTQFEPTDARRAFPCFDEPAQKATFTVELTVPPGMEAISNTVVTNKTRTKNGWQKIQFAPTPKMSTYLLAFIIGKFEFIEDLTEDGVTVRVYVTPGKKSQAKFALEAGKQILTFYNRYFKIKYPLPTMDMIAVPDFAAGAMENWGAVTYRETAILVDPKNSSTLSKQWVALVIAHELAHQWFGNLVTMEWWTHLWLNEGFASYISYLAVDDAFPEWNMWSQFMNAELGPALELDSLKNTHPIQVEVHHPNEINEIFDEVSYAKGASVLRMLASYLGPVKFRDGLRHYLKTYQYSNARTEDLWRSLEIVSRKPVRKVMQNWTAEPGYPLVTVSESGARLKLSQKRFYGDHKENKKPNRTAWSIPVSVGDNKVKKQVLFDRKSSALSKPSGSYTKINVGETAVFRTMYSAGLLNRMLPAIREQKMPTPDRLGIIRDSLALARGGQMPTDKVLDILSNYSNETKYTVWVEMGITLGMANRLFRNEKFNPQLRKFICSVYAPMAESIGWEPKPKESHSQGLLRGFILQRAGQYGHKPTVERAQRLFTDYVTKKTVIPADLRSVVYNTVAEHGTEKDFNQIMSLYRKETLQEEKNRLARALALFPNEKLLKRFLNFALSKDVRPQDAPLLIISAWTNRAAKQHVWKFITANWAKIVKRYGEGGHLLVRFIDPASNFTTEKEAKMVADFFRKHPAPGGERTVRQTVEEIRIQAAWANRDRQKVQKFLGKLRV